MQTMYNDHLEMKTVVNKFTAGLGQMDAMNQHMERMAAELAHMRVVGVGGGGGGMSKQMSDQWDTIVQTVQQNNMAVKEAYKSRADLQMQVSALQSQVQALKDGEGWKERLMRLTEAAEQHEERLSSLEERIDTQESKLDKLNADFVGFQEAYTERDSETVEAINNIQERLTTSENESGELIGKLQRVTRELKEDVMKHTEELRSVHEAAAVSCSSQLEMIDNIRVALKDLHMRLDPSSMEKQRLDDALAAYDQVVEEEESEPSTWNKMKKRANAVSELSLAVASGLSAAGKKSSGMSDKTVRRLEQIVEKLKGDFIELDAQFSAQDKKVSGHASALHVMEEEVQRIIQRFAGGENIVSHSEMENYTVSQREIVMREVHLAMRRIDELCGQTETLAEQKMNRDDSISRQYLEKAIGEISMEFAAALQRNRQEINRYLNDKAQADVLMDMEGRFGQRLQQMEAILMKGVKGLDERASMALMRKADAATVQRLQDRLELLVSDMQDQQRSLSPEAALSLGNTCLSCNGPVRGGSDSFSDHTGGYPRSPARSRMESPALPEMPNWHSSHSTDIRSASRNARMGPPPRSVAGSRTPSRMSYEDPTHWSDADHTQRVALGRTASTEPPILEHPHPQHLSGRGPPLEEGHLPSPSKAKRNPSGRINSGRSSLGSARSEQGEWDGSSLGGLPSVRA